MSEEEIIEKVEEELKYGENCTYKYLLRQILKLYQKEKEKNVKAIEMLQKHIKHCEQEAKGSLNNEICHIALKFDKHLLQELLEEK